MQMVLVLLAKEISLKIMQLSKFNRGGWNFSENAVKIKIMFLLRKLGLHTLNNTELSQTKVDIREKIMVKLLVVSPK